MVSNFGVDKKMKSRTLLLSVGLITASLAVMSFCFYYWNTTIAPSRAMTVRIDGQPVDVLSRAKTVGSLLADMSIHVNKGDIVKPTLTAALEDGMEIDIRPLKRVSLDIDGSIREVATNSISIPDLLDEAGVECGQDDLIEPAPSAKVKDGLKIRLSKATYQEVVVKETIAKKETTVEDDTVFRGSKKIISNGRNGEMQRVYRVCMRQGKELRRELIEEKIAITPADKVVAVGTKTMNLASRHKEGETNAAQPEYGAISNVQEGQASYYTLNGKGIGMTAAHKSLPFGTVVKVTNLNNGKTVNVTINDRGPYVAGRIIDLATDAFRVIESQSRGVCPVKIEW